MSKATDSKVTPVFSFDVFDTKTLADVGVEVEILKPDGESSGLYVTVLGRDSAVFQKLMDKFVRANLRTQAKAGRNATDLLYEQGRSNDLDLVAECTLGMRTVDGSKVNVDVEDKDGLRAMYERMPLLFEQVRSAMHDRSRFTKG